ncbi:hypothetical protein [Paucibacter soli]|uniref:hypothetical protein n=1 Tax=Paucibacter soli TaxID=3133433 RepID=UPI0030A2F120
MTHQIAKRNIEARVVRPMAIRLARLIELMSRYWVDPELASSDAKERRLAITKAYLVNALGLTMLVESRYTEDHGEKQIHHLPRQAPEVVAAGIEFLSEHEVQHGVADALRALVNRHPYADGGLPEKPDYTLEEARAKGLKRRRGPEAVNRKQEAFKLICEGWVSNKEWAEQTGSTRLSEYIRQLKEDDKLDVSVDYRQSESDTNQKYAYYHFYENDGERAAWNEAQAIKEFMQNEALAKKAEEAARDRMATRVAARRARAGSLSGATQRYGGWQKPAPGMQPQPGKPRTLFKAPETPVARTPPPAAAMNRLQSLQQRISPPEDISAPGIPAAELNRLKPNAASREVVQLGDNRYSRRFTPGEKDSQGKVTSWKAEWILMDGPQTA